MGQAKRTAALSSRFELDFRKLLVATWLACVVASAGCVSDSYRYGVGTTLSQTKPLVPESANPISHGVPQPKVDRIENFVQSPKKLFRKIARRPALDPNAEAQQREAATELASEYLAANGLNEIFIDVRVYQPREQWERLKSNQDIKPIWKYTGGTLNWLRYAILPMRAFHSDHYDPFTNTLNLNSTQPTEALYESALAKEYQRHRRLGVGAYAIMQYVPFVPLVHNAKASSDVLTFSEHHLDGELTDELYPCSLFATWFNCGFRNPVSRDSLAQRADLYRPLATRRRRYRGSFDGNNVSATKERLLTAPHSGKYKLDASE